MTPPLPTRAGLATRARPHATAGFILSETLATFIISAFILAGLASMAPLLTNAIDRSVASVQNVDALGRTLMSLRQGISGLTRARWNGVEPQGFVFRGGPNSLFFAHRGIGRGDRPELQVTALREIVTASGPRWMRSEARLSPTATSFDDLKFGVQRELDTGPARLRLWYQPPTASHDNMKATRVRTWPAGRRLPDAVVIEAVDAASTKLIMTIEVPIRANADVGCLLRGLQAQPTGPPVNGSVAVQSPTTISESTEVNAAAYLAGANGTAATTANPLSEQDQNSGDTVLCGRDDVDGPVRVPSGSPTSNGL